MQTVSLEEAVAKVPSGASLMIGGFMGVGTPERLIDELVRQGKRNLTVIANDTALPGRGIGKLIDARLVGRTVAVVADYSLVMHRQPDRYLKYTTEQQCNMFGHLYAEHPEQLNPPLKLKEGERVKWRCSVAMD